MKKALIILAGCCSGAQTFAQGTLVFANLASGVNAPITYSTVGPCVGLTNPIFVADLYWSNTTNAPSDSLTAAGFNVPFSTATAGGGGYFFGGTRTVTGAGGFIEAQVRVWDSRFGGTFDAARTSSACRLRSLWSWLFPQLLRRRWQACKVSHYAFPNLPRSHWQPWRLF
jgi:hypothetical protein